MKRLLLLLALAVVVTAIPARAEAAVPCRNKIYNDWYHDGKIASTYPVSCYRDALANVKGDLKVYSSLTDDIRSAMQAAIARANGSTVPDQVGKGLPPGTKPVLVDNHKTKTTRTTSTGETEVVTNVNGPTDADNGGGIPTPLLVLAGLAILLAAAGAIGMLARRGRGNDPAV